MLDSKHSTVTYASISSDDGSLDVGSPRFVVLGYDGLPMMPKDPYAYVEAVMQEPPPLDFDLKLLYPEFMTPEDDVLLAEEQPLPVEEEDDEDPEEDPADYPTDRDKEEEEDESSRDDVDDEEEDEDEEEKHLALADFVPPPAYRTTARMSIRAQTPIPFLYEIEVGRLLVKPKI
nr:hypothetical protein [Tanacetum cinerariifolium]